MKRFFPILTASFCIIGLGAQVSSGMILPFEQFPDATADYKSTAFLLPTSRKRKSTRLRESSC